ncbi:uncharacterized protein LOC131940006 [Physella acuta]|uniref:uncharacterized protein LOC131940006 n=1 Tax=Physella acuta TaxID=109671 RepID=UPI0027DC3E95|nr:uncharacterized protein LOC131940006 [Physella acuta]
MANVPLATEAWPEENVATKACNGGQVFLLFVKQRLKDDNPELISQLSFLSTAQAKENVELKHVCAGLEDVARHFLNSKHRKLTRDEAMAHSLDVKEQDFKSIVQEVLAAATQNVSEHIIVVFFFLYDYVMRMYSKGIAKMDQVLGWCQTAVVEGIDPKVTQVGGWAHVFSKKKPKQRPQSSSSLFSRLLFWRK